MEIDFMLSDTIEVSAPSIKGIWQGPRHLLINFISFIHSSISALAGSPPQARSQTYVRGSSHRCR